MRGPFRFGVALIVASLLGWYGVLSSVPHEHGDESVPREEIACSAMDSPAPADHLHSAGKVLAPHTCIACLAASTSMAPSSVITLVDEPTITALTIAPSVDCCLQSFSSFPMLRGPPQIV